MTALCVQGTRHFYCSNDVVAVTREEGRLFQVSSRQLGLDRFLFATSCV